MSTRTTSGKSTTMTTGTDDVSLIADTETTSDAAVSEETGISDAPQDTDLVADNAPTGSPRGTRRLQRRRVIAFGFLPALAILLTGGAGYLKWQSASARGSQDAAAQSVRAASDDTVALLTYHPDTVDKDLGSARDRLTGSFRDEYTRLINGVVIPGAKQKRISAVATVHAAASVSATENQAIVLVFVNQTTTVGDDPPADSASSIRVTLNKVDEKWLVSGFIPI
jgi:Mce-associated membrane protein